MCGLDQALAACSPVMRWLGGLLGTRCQSCLAPLGSGALLCESCAERFMPRVGGYCPRCGDCYADASGDVYLCRSCRISPPRWSALYFFGPYRAELKDLIHRYKFSCDLGAESLIRSVVESVCEIRQPRLPDCVVPVPLQRQRLLGRGFNQSCEIARMVAKCLSRPLLPTALSKCRNTVPQSSLGRLARVENVRGAFVADTELSGRHVLLVDDVMTTGATLSECAAACLKAGALSVDVFILARALRT